MKLFLPIASLCVAFLVAVAIFTSCQKEAQQIIPEAKVGQTAEETTLPDRMPAPPTVTYSFTVGNAVDQQYRVRNSAGTYNYFSKNFFTTVGSCTSGVPTLDPGATVQVRARRQYAGAGTEIISWTINRTGCPTINGTLSVTAPSTTSWSSIPWVTLTSLGECF